METGILEVGEYVIYEDFSGLSVVCEVMEIKDKELIALLRPTRKFNFFGSTNEMLWCNYKAIRYREFDSKKFLPPQPGTWVYHKDHCNGTKQIFVDKILPKCGLFIGSDLDSIPYKDSPFTFEGVFLEPLQASDGKIELANEEISKETTKESSKSTPYKSNSLEHAAKIASACYFDNDSIERQKERAIAFQVRFLTDERLCEFRKMLGNAYENARVVGFIRKDGVFELKYDNVSQKTIEKIAEKITVYTKQNFPELIIEE